MPQFNEAPIPDEGAAGLARLVEMLGLKIAPEDLAALSQQLRLLEALEIDELEDYAPILKMDAAWHD